MPRRRAVLLLLLLLALLLLPVSLLLRRSGGLSSAPRAFTLTVPAVHSRSTTPPPPADHTSTEPIPAPRPPLGPRPPPPRYPLRHLLRDAASASLMTLVISGGSKPQTVANRQAAMDTWFDQDTHLVGRFAAGAAAKFKTIDLGQAVEDRAAAHLPYKVQHMWHHVYRHHLHKYQWFVKADDDTYLNLPRLKKLLGLFDYNTPLYLGRPYGGGLQRLDLVGSPGPQWRDKAEVAFCHGGSGYILSREMLRRVGPHLLRYAAENNQSRNEDTTVGLMIHEVVGSRCLQFNGNMFGGIDLLVNDHDQSHVLSQLKELAEKAPEQLWKTTSLHVAEANATRLMHRLLSELREKNGAWLENYTNVAGEEELEGDLRRVLVTSYVCSLTPEVGKPIPALCYNRALYSRPVGDVLEAAFQPQMADVFQLEGKFASGPGRPCPWSGGWRRLWMDRRALVLVALAPAHYATSQSYRWLYNRFMRSLRQFSTADVAILLPANETGWVGSAEAQKYCGVTFHRYDTDLAEPWRPKRSRVENLALASFLEAQKQAYARVLRLPLDTLFQRDPFAALPSAYDGLLVFVDNPVVEHQGLCSAARWEFDSERRLALVTEMVAGTTTALAKLYRLLVDVPWLLSSCLAEDYLMGLIYMHSLPRHHDVAVVMPQHSPLLVYPRRGAAISQEARGVLYSNSEGVVAAAVVGMAGHL